MQTYPPGTRIGQYEIASLPMMGGMGVVYFALDHGNEGRPLALKTFRPELLPDRAARDRFLREGTAWIELGTHPHIVRCYKVEYIDPTAFLVLELIAKEQNMSDASLRSWLIPGQPLSLEQALAFALQIARGMQHATEKISGFVHRDLKPENILVGADTLPGTNLNRLRVTDFGLVKTVAGSAVAAMSGSSEDLKPNQVQFTRGVGTPLYMAPEQWMGAPVGIFTDVYAFGCIFYEMLSGEHAASGKTIADLRVSHCNGKLRFTPTSWSGDFKTLLSKCLLVNPLHRFSNWNEIIDEMDRAYNRYIGHPVSQPITQAQLSPNEQIQTGWSLIAIGRAYHDIGKLGVAKDYLQKVLVLSGDFGDRRLEGVALSNLGVTNLDLGDTRHAIGFFDKCLALARGLNARAQEGVILGDLGVAYRNLGEVKRAIEFHEKELSIARETGGYRNVQKALENLGSAYRNLGELSRAIDYYEQALSMANQTGDKLRQGAILGGLGGVYLALGNISDAISYIEQALTAARDIGDRYGEATALGDLGLAYANLGSIPRSMDYLEQAMVIIDEMGDRRLKGKCLNNLGSAYLNQQDVERAVDCYKQSLAISREVGDRDGESTTLTNLGSGYLILGKTTQAIEFFEQALTILHEIGDKRGISATLDFLGNAYSDLGDSGQAIKFHKQALVLARQIGDRDREASALSNLGIDHRAIKDAKAAVSYFEEALKISREIGNRLGEGKVLHNLGIAYEERQDPTRALNSYAEALIIHRELDDSSSEANDSSNMALLYHQMGDNTKAISLGLEAAKIWTQDGHPNAVGARKWVVELQLISISDDKRSQLLSDAHEAFLRAESFTNLRDLIGQYPIIADDRFIQILENALAQDMVSLEYRDYFRQRLTWLKQIAGK